MARSKTSEVVAEGSERRSDERNRIIAALFEQEYDRLRRLAFVILGEAGAAEEIAMDAFARALAGWKAFSEVEGPVPYLHKMVVNACRSKLRRAVIERRTAALLRRREESQDPLDIDARPDSLEIWRAVRELPPLQRICIVLRYLEDMKETQIADLLDIPLGSVKSHSSRGRARLAQSLGPSFGGEVR